MKKLCRTFITILASAVAVCAAGCATTTSRNDLGTLPTVQKVDLDRYLGTWFEIAHFPHSFQKNCYASSATYKLREDGQIDVINRCRKGAVDGKEKVAKGRAKVVDTESNAKLKVSFFRPFWGDYWIIDLGDDYQYAVVGHPSRDYLWILSRTPQMDPKLYEQILQRLIKQGYDVDRLVKTIHES